MSRERGAPVTRQFFAGTACPSCRTLDKVRRCEDALGTIWLECVACGYTQDLTEGYVEPTESGPSPVKWLPPASRR